MLVSRSIAEDIWTVEGPEITFAGAPMHTRMTVVRLQNGQLWIHSPIAFNDEVEAFLVGLGGTVSAVIAPNKFHHLWVSEWCERYPTATVFAEPTLKQKISSLSAANDITDTAPALYASDIDQLIFAGNRLFQEAVFFHKASGTLIFTDLLINIEPHGVPRLARWFLKFEGVTFPSGGVPRLYRWFTSDRKRAKACAEKLLEWSPRHLVFSHGEPFTEDPLAVLKREFDYLLKDR